MTQRTTKFDEGRELVRRWRASGKNQSEFCRAMGIPPQRLHYWRQRVTDEDLELPTPSFVAVQVRPPTTSEGVEVVLSNGRVVRVRGTVDGELLRQVLAAAEGGC